MIKHPTLPDSSLANPPTILVVEDDEGAATLVKTHLSRAGYEVIVSWSAEVALELIERSLPDAVLLDLNLPGMDGYDFCKRLRATAGGKGIPVIILSAQKSRESVLKALQAGANDFIIKPIDGHLLLHKIHTNLNDGGNEEEAADELGEELEKLPDSREEREFIRIREQAEAVLHLPLEVVDLSEGGAGLMSPSPVHPGALLTLQCHKLEAVCGLKEVMVRVRYSVQFGGKRKYRLGVEFVGLGESARKQIRSYIFKQQAARVKLN